MELYAEVRGSVYVEGLSERAAARRFGLARETVRKMLRYSAPPGYRRAQPPRRPEASLRDAAPPAGWSTFPPPPWSTFAPPLTREFSRPGVRPSDYLILRSGRRFFQSF